MRSPRTGFHARLATSICGLSVAPTTLNVFGALLKGSVHRLPTSPSKNFSKPGTVIQVGVSPRRIDILTEITGVDFHDAQAEQLIVDIEGLTIPVIGRTHLIKNKRALGRPQDQADVARLEANQS